MIAAGSEGGACQRVAPPPHAVSDSTVAAVDGAVDTLVAVKQGGLQHVGPAHFNREGPVGSLRRLALSVHLTLSMLRLQSKNRLRDLPHIFGKTVEQLADHLEG